MYRIPLLATGFVFAILFTALAPGADAGTTTCNIPTSCAFFANTSSGPGVHSASVSGAGLRGTSGSGPGVYGASDSGALVVPQPGVEGESTSPFGMAGGFGYAPYLAQTAGPELGVFGYGRAGVYAITSSAGNLKATYGIAVAGIDMSTAAPDFNTAIFGQSSVGTALLGWSGGIPPYFNVRSHNPIGLYAAASAPQGSTAPSDAIGVFIQTDSEAIDALNLTTKATLDVETAANLIDGTTPNGSFAIDNSGNETLSGTLTTSTTPITVAADADGSKRASYGARTTTPDMEDIGQTTIANGRGYVRIDAALHGAIDQRSAYLVFLTPEGDCNGLFVTRKSPDGFEIRELHGGRSSLAVDYRIVARPLGDGGQRLAVTQLTKVPANRAERMPSFDSTFLSPRDRMKARLGPLGFAKAVREARERLNER